MAPEDLLLAARDIMRDRGLARGGYEGPNGSVCMEGAIGVALTGNAHDVAHPAMTVLDDVCEARYGVCTPSANDHLIADLDEACDVLEAAAKRAASGGGLHE